jgi:hypothetical protein
MSRWLIQCLTVATMLASLLHGQCLFSCSLQSPAHATVAAHVKSSGHSCCPEPDGQKGKNSEKPCQPDSPAISPAGSDAQLTSNLVLPIVLLEQPGGLPLPPDFSIRITTDFPPDSSSLGLRSSICILRI